MSVTTAAVIPTRNRASLAMRAALSLLEQDVPIEVFISDNSSSGEELESFCRQHPRINYLRPAAELAMPDHWDWAIAQVLERSQATHVTVHYDRRLSKPGVWREVVRTAGTFPLDVISFPADFVSKQPPPLRLWQTPWTGKRFSVESGRMASLIAKGTDVAAIAHAIPILSNCLVPRGVLLRIGERFGDVCNSTGPDGCFLMRFAALYDRYIHFDLPTGIIYASERSNGLGYLRGTGGDFPDFRKAFADRPWLDAAPIPGLSLGMNMLYHEYELVRREFPDRFDPLDREGVLADLGTSMRWIEDPVVKARVRQILVDQGWSGSDPEPFPKRNWRTIRYELSEKLAEKFLGHSPRNICGFSFRNDDAAIEWALKYPRMRQEDLAHLALLEPEELVVA